MPLMAALSTSASLIPFNRISQGAKRWGNLFCVPKRCSFHSSISATKKGIIVVASSGGAFSSSQTETAAPPQRTYTWPDNRRPRVCILGGGFGGLYTALRLESLVWADDKKPQVLLVDQSERFVFKPLLYELLSGEVDVWEIAPRFSDLLASTSIQFFQDKVKLLHPSDHLGSNGSAGSYSGGTVLLESGLLIEYDWLVLALGAETKLDIIPGAAEFALPFSTLEDAVKVDHKLRTLERRKFSKDSLIHVAVVGCGYSGVELATTISERLQDRGAVQAINVETTILPTAPPGNREAALKVLESRRVQLVLGYFVRCIQRANELDVSGMSKEPSETQYMVSEHRAESFVLELQPAQRGLQSQILEADLVLWTVGSKPLLPQLEPSDKAHELPLNAMGKAETDETLRVKGHPRTFSLGDSSALRDSNGGFFQQLLRFIYFNCCMNPYSVLHPRKVAFQQADFTGWNLWAGINDRPLLPFRFQSLGEMMTLGRHDAALSPTFMDGLTLEGPIGHTARKIAYLIRLPTDEHRIKVGISWLAKSAVDSVASLQTTLTKVLSGP